MAEPDKDWVTRESDLRFGARAFTGIMLAMYLLLVTLKLSGLMGWPWWNILAIPGLLFGQLAAMCAFPLWFGDRYGRAAYFLFAIACVAILWSIASS